jgi:hypothetical protein
MLLSTDIGGLHHAARLKQPSTKQATNMSSPHPVPVMCFISLVSHSAGSHRVAQVFKLHGQRIAFLVAIRQGPWEFGIANQNDMGAGVSGTAQAYRWR